MSETNWMWAIIFTAVVIFGVKYTPIRTSKNGECMFYKGSLFCRVEPRGITYLNIPADEVLDK